MANYKLSAAGGLSAFPVASVFVDKYMPVANATFVKVYLYGLRMCYAVGADVDNAGIARALDILESDVVRAWKYWESVGAVVIHENNLIEFVDLAVLEPQKKDTVKKPKYSSAELAEAVGESDDLQLLLEHAQNIFGKTFSVSDISTLYSFIDWLKLPVEVVLMLLEHCASLGKCSVKYAERVAVSWAEDGVDTIEKAEQHLARVQEKSNLARIYQRMFKKTGRDFSDAEYAYLLQWTKEMKMPQELIKTAYEKSVLSTGNISFPYINAILLSWYKQGIRTVDQLKNDRKKPVQAEKVERKNKFVGYEQSGQYDFDEIEKIALNKRMKAVGETDEQ